MQQKHVRVLLLIAVLVSAAGWLQAQSLGDIARREQAKKGPGPRSGKVITNDDMIDLKRDSIQQPGLSNSAKNNADSADTSKTTSNSESKGDAATGEAAQEQSGSSEDKPSQEADLKAKFNEQKGKIDLLQREIDVMQREQKLRATMYYSDAGNKLRDPKRFGDEQQKLNDDIDRKKKELDAAKAELERIKEEARKAGLRIS